MHLDGEEAYNARIEQLRSEEWPMLQDAVYLDHAGTVPYSKTFMRRFSDLMISNLYGNPHSASPSSQKSTQMIDDSRLDLLHFMKADPSDFDLVFVANATAGIKLVAEAFRDHPGGFTYVYHGESHTSLVGARELARDHLCLSSDSETETWLNRSQDSKLSLFAYPAQSNMNGRRLPLGWCARSRQNNGSQVYSLLDAAAHLSTSPLDLSDSFSAPDFTVFSLYKIFGFPDLGALVVRKAAAPILQQRRYFGGGTVDMVALLDEQWHAKKSGSLHAQLEDGTLPIHSIAAIKPALETHAELFESLERASRHTAWLADRLFQRLVSFTHANNKPVTRVYARENVNYRDTSTQGPIVAFNLLDDTGGWVNNSEIEKLASIGNIHLRTGGLCSPGGIATSLNLAAWEMRENFSAGHRCGAEDSIVNGKPTGVVRASLGATSTLRDVELLLAFLTEFFVSTRCSANEDPKPVPLQPAFDMFIDALTVYPVKSCAGFQVPPGESWIIGPEGMQWDREWCIIHQGTGAVLSQKQYPRMALLQPTINVRSGTLDLFIPPSSSKSKTILSVPLSHDPRPFKTQTFQNATVCDDKIEALRYKSDSISDTLSEFLDVKCQLARFPPAKNAASTRHSKAHLLTNITPAAARPIMFSNESPILTINKSSLDALNQAITTRSGPEKTVSPSAFRANIVLAPATSSSQPQPQNNAWIEDTWTHYEITHESRPQGSASDPEPMTSSSDPHQAVRLYTLDVLGSCRRCQMVCIDQATGERQAEPFVTLAKTRRMAFPAVGTSTPSASTDTSTDTGTDTSTSTSPGPGSGSGPGSEARPGPGPAGPSANSTSRARCNESRGVEDRVKTVQGVFFGVHTALANAGQGRVRVGDRVKAFCRRDGPH